MRRPRTASQPSRQQPERGRGPSGGGADGLSARAALLSAVEPDCPVLAIGFDNGLVQVRNMEYPQH